MHLLYNKYSETPQADLHRRFPVWKTDVLTAELCEVLDGKPFLHHWDDVLHKLPVKSAGGFEPPFSG